MKLPAAILGFANLPLGLGNGLMLSAVPQLLAARHVPEPVISDITTIGLLPGFAIFLAGPLLDLRFSRRAYAAAATVVTAFASLAAVLALAHPVLLGVAVFVVSAASSVNLIAIGGWFGSVLEKDRDASLGTWMSVSFTVGFSLMAVEAVPIVHALPPLAAAVLLALPVLAPCLIYAALPAPPPPDASLSREGFGVFLGRIVALLRRREIVRLLVLFVLPTGCFALTNTLSGLGGDYHASERFVGLINSVAVTITGVGGALLVPVLVRRSATWRWYLGVGVAGAAATLLFAVLPRTPSVFAVAMVAENLAQALTLTMATVAALQSLDHGAPLAATQFGLITAVPQLPVTYMQWLDGHVYWAGGLAGMYAVDGALSLAACVAMALLSRGVWGQGPSGVQGPVRSTPAA